MLFWVVSVTHAGQRRRLPYDVWIQSRNHYHQRSGVTANTAMLDVRHRERRAVAATQIVDLVSQRIHVRHELKAQGDIAFVQ